MQKGEIYEFKENRKMSEIDFEQKLEHIGKTIENVKRNVEDLERSFSELKIIHEKKSLTKVYIRLFYNCEDTVNRAKRGVYFGYIKEQEYIKKISFMKAVILNLLRRNLQ